MIRVLLVFGTRPEAIKLAPVVRALEARGNEFETRLCLTAQHREMLDQVMQCFELKADFDLNLMRDDQTPGQIAAAVLTELPHLLEQIRPDVLLVQGDTMTTFAASFAAFLQHIPVGHVEAGLRTGNFEQPFPEEMNRVLTSRIASLHFVPTETAEKALLAEGIPPARIVRTGNTVIDALLHIVDQNFSFADDFVANRDSSVPFVLITTHRRENFGPPLKEICRAIAELADRCRDHDFIVPVHRNPNVRRTVEGRLAQHTNVYLTPPLAYREFANLMARARLILTDSGGIQEEAPSLNVPVLVLRDVTERPEGVAAGAAQLVGTTTEHIVDATLELLQDPSRHARMANVDNPYGDGRAAERIVDALAARFAPPA